jgi:hypothetical protein
MTSVVVSGGGAGIVSVVFSAGGAGSTSVVVSMTVVGTETISVIVLAEGAGVVGVSVGQLVVSLVSTTTVVPTSVVGTTTGLEGSTLGIGVGSTGWVRGGVTPEGVPADGVTAEGVPTGVTAEGVPAEGVPLTTGTVVGTGVTSSLGHSVVALVVTMMSTVVVSSQPPVQLVMVSRAVEVLVDSTGSVTWAWEKATKAKMLRAAAFFISNGCIFTRSGMENSDCFDSEWC